MEIERKEKARRGFGWAPNRDDEKDNSPIQHNRTSFPSVQHSSVTVFGE
jgi:hypothetical protein